MKTKDIKKQDPRQSLEEKLISGFFICSFLFGLLISFPTMTGNVIGSYPMDFNFHGISLLIVGLAGFLVNKKYKR